MKLMMHILFVLEAIFPDKIKVQKCISLTWTFRTSSACDGVIIKHEK